jgi:hypothetical protein
MNQTTCVIRPVFCYSLHKMHNQKNEFEYAMNIYGDQFLFKGWSWIYLCNDKKIPWKWLLVTMDIQHILHFPTMFENHQGCSKSHPFHHWNIVATFIDANNFELNLHHQQFMCLCLSYNHQLIIKKYWTKRPCTWNKRKPKIELIKLST